jgi:hypothetical protein
MPVGDNLRAEASTLTMESYADLGNSMLDSRAVGAVETALEPCAGGSGPPSEAETQGSERIKDSRVWMVANQVQYSDSPKTGVAKHG